MSDVPVFRYSLQEQARIEHAFQTIRSELRDLGEHRMYLTVEQSEQLHWLIDIISPDVPAEAKSKPPARKAAKK